MMVSPELMASTKWNKSKNILNDQSVFDPSTREWRNGEEPTLQEAYRKYIGIFNAELDTKDQVYKLQLEHYSPNIAEWLNQIITQINDLEELLM